MDTDETQATSSTPAAMGVPQVGRLVSTADPWEPYRLLDPAGVAVGAVASFLRDLQAWRSVGHEMLMRPDSA